MKKKFFWNRFWKKFQVAIQASEAASVLMQINSFKNGQN